MFGWALALSHGSSWGAQALKNPCCDRGLWDFLGFLASSVRRRGCPSNRESRPTAVAGVLAGKKIGYPNFCPNFGSGVAISWKGPEIDPSIDRRGGAGDHPRAICSLPPSARSPEGPWRPRNTSVAKNRSQSLLQGHRDAPVAREPGDELAYASLLRDVGGLRQKAGLEAYLRGLHRSTYRKTSRFGFYSLIRLAVRPGLSGLPLVRGALARLL